MDAYLCWAVAGIVLIIVEMLSATFYLLVLGIAALAAALNMVVLECNRYRLRL